jgi:aminopeptidase-like protein
MIKYYNIGKNILYPICRSLTGKGVVKTLKTIQNEFPSLKIKKIKSGTKVFDWRIPSEWNVTDAYVLDKNGLKVIDFKKNNLHLMGYSIPINKSIKKKDLLKKLIYLENQPTAIPYITSYYSKNWSFCVCFDQYKKIKDTYLDSDRFKVVIKSNLNTKGNLTYGELILNGKSKQELLISTYICHPSMANNELSGPIVSMGLINYFSKIKKLKKTLRFVFIPETIGSIAYLSKHLKFLKENVVAGYNLSCIGDERQHSCMFSKNKNSPSDKAIIQAYKKLGIKDYKIYSFLERGSDERQYNSAGVDLPISSIFRTKYGKYPEYHTSLDNFNLVTLKGTTGGFKVAKEAINIILNNIYPKSKVLCEPQMGKRGLTNNLSTKQGRSQNYKNIQNFLQYADRKNCLTMISKLIKVDLKSTKRVFKQLLKHDLITY